MKKTYFGAAFAAVVLLSCLAWYGCKKDEDLAAAMNNGVIYGIVTDYDTGNPISHANVTLRPGGETTLTGSDGSFEFQELANGDYTLSFSKSGYSDLYDDYTLTVTNGRNVRRDVQMKALYLSARITVNGMETDTLDFGADPSFVRMNYTIENNGTSYLNDTRVRTSCDWITLSGNNNSAYTIGDIGPSYGRTEYLVIHRDELNVGNNTGYLYISSGTYTKTVVIKAAGLSVPVVANPTLTNISTYYCNASSSVINDGGWAIQDKGFEFYWGNTRRELSCGPGPNNFQGQCDGNNYYTIHRVRAYAYNGVYVGYSDWVPTGN